jgi:hypothetical protein
MEKRIPGSAGSAQAETEILFHKPGSEALSCRTPIFHHYEANPINRAFGGCFKSSFHQGQETTQFAILSLPRR